MSDPFDAAGEDDSEACGVEDEEPDNPDDWRAHAEDHESLRDEMMDREDWPVI